MAGDSRQVHPGRGRALLATPAPFLVFLAAAIVLRPMADPDYWWHVRVGDWILEHGAVPRTEILSWLSGGGSWTAPSWGSEVAFALVDRSVGPLPISLFFAGIAMAILGLVAALARHVQPRLGATALAALVFVATLVTAPVWLPRSQLFDALFALCSVLAMFRYLDRGDRRGLWIMPVLMIIWANVHGAGAVVFVLAALGVVAGEWWNRRPRAGHRASATVRQPWTPLLVSIVVTIAAISVNPYGPLLYVYGFTSTASGITADAIQEWNSPDFHTTVMRPAQIFVAFGLVGLMGLVRIRDGRILALVAGFTFMFLQSGRYVGLLGPVSVGLAGPALLAALGIATGRLPQVRLRFHDGHRRFAGVIGAIVGLAILGSRLLTMPASQEAAVTGYQPVDAATWLQANPQPGRLFNEYGWGGYLSYRLQDAVGPYGASDAFGDATLGEIFGVLTGTADPAPFLDSRDVETVLVPGASPLANWLTVAPGWQEAYRDDRATIFVREPAPGG